MFHIESPYTSNYNWSNINTFHIILCTMHLCECFFHLISDQHYVYESIYESIIWQAFKYKGCASKVTLMCKLKD